MLQHKSYSTVYSLHGSTATSAEHILLLQTEKMSSTYGAQLWLHKDPKQLTDCHIVTYYTAQHFSLTQATSPHPLHHPWFDHPNNNKQFSLMFIRCIMRHIAKTTNTCTELYHSFIQYTGSYMFRQWSAIIREILGFVLVTCWEA
jgi:hypothetical protein